MKKLLAITLGLTVTSGCLAQNTPWVTEPGSTTFSLSQVHQTQDELYAKEKKSELPDDLKQDTTWFSLQYGVSDNLSLDVKTGYARSSFKPAESNHKSGRTDSNIGMTWRAIDEILSDTAMPSIAFRAGVILQGDYETGTVHAIGDGSDGFEFSLIGGKVLTDWLALSGEYGYRARNSDVPDDIFYNIGSYLSPGANITLSLAYSHTNAQDGINIGDAKFNGENFHRLEEDVELIDLGASYRMNPQASLGFNAGNVIDGKNTSKSEVYSFFIGYAL